MSFGGVRPPLPSNDKRWRVVDTTMRRNGYQSHALIEALHSVQEMFGFLDQDALAYVATALHAAPSRVYAVATFYNHFTLKPQGAHTCVICTGTACYIKGAPRLLTTIDKKLRIKPGETTQDKQVSLLQARCLGSCSLAPAGVFDGEVVGLLTPDEVVARLVRWDDHAD